MSKFRTSVQKVEKFHKLRVCVCLNLSNDVYNWDGTWKWYHMSLQSQRGYIEILHWSNGGS